jgi:hypothetical protein
VEKEVVFGKEYIKCGVRSGMRRGKYKTWRKKKLVERNIKNDHKQTVLRNEYNKSGGRKGISKRKYKMWRKKWYLERNIQNVEKEVVFGKEYFMRCSSAE